MGRRKTQILEDEQPFLPEMPSASPIGKAAKAFMRICDEIDETHEALKKKKTEAKMKLLDLMKEEKQEEIVVDGLTFRRVYVAESDEIRIYNKKKKKSQSDEE